jgi:ABC-type cobalamin/Fe3+-siderophores transport system ATPase subunit
MLRRNLFAYLKTKGITCIVATHDSTDALSYADQTIVLQNGTLIDKGDSFHLYNNQLINMWPPSLEKSTN